MNPRLKPTYCHRLYRAARNQNFAFPEIEVTSIDHAAGIHRKVVWEDLGEGLEGDFNPDDKLDYGHLRFSCYKLVNGDWEQMDDASYCTRLPITTSKRILKSAARPILEAIENNSYKKRLEELSWLCLEDFVDKPIKH